MFCGQWCGEVPLHAQAIPKGENALVFRLSGADEAAVQAPAFQGERSSPPRGSGLQAKRCGTQMTARAEPLGGGRRKARDASSVGLSDDDGAGPSGPHGDLHAGEGQSTRLVVVFSAQGLF